MCRVKIPCVYVPGAFLSIIGGGQKGHPFVGETDLHWVLVAQKFKFSAVYEGKKKQATTKKYGINNNPVGGKPKTTHFTPERPCTAVPFSRLGGFSTKLLSIELISK